MKNYMKFSFFLVVATSMLNSTDTSGMEKKKLIRTLTGHKDTIRAVAFSPDGETFLTASWDDTVQIWDLMSGKCLTTLEGHKHGILSAVYSPNGRFIATGSWDNTAKLWDVRSGKCLLTFNNNSWLYSKLFGAGPGVHSVIFSPDGKRLITQSTGTAPKVWDSDPQSKTYGKWLNILQGHTKDILTVMFSHNGKYVITGSEDTTAKVWNVSSGKCVSTFKGHKESVVSLGFSSDDKYVVTGSTDNTARVWEVNSGKCLAVLQGHKAQIFYVAFGFEDSRIVTGSDDKRVKIWETNFLLNTCSDIQVGTCLHSLKGHTDFITSIALSSGCGQIVTASQDSTARVWSMESGECLAKLKGHKDRIMSVAFAPYDGHMVTGSADNTVKVWAPIEIELENCDEKESNINQFENDIELEDVIINGDFEWSPPEYLKNRLLVDEVSEN